MQNFKLKIHCTVYETNHIKPTDNMIKTKPKKYIFRKILVFVYTEMPTTAW